MLTALYTSPEIDKCIARLIPKDLRQDFKQELFLILLQIPSEIIARMNGSLKYFVVRIILNLARQKNNIFHKKYLNKTTELKDYPDEPNLIEERIELEAIEDKIIMNLENIDTALGNSSYPYHREIIKLLAEYGSIREVSRQTDIPRVSLGRTINKVRKKLK